MADLIEKGIDKGLGLLGERVGQAGVDVMRQASSEADREGGWLAWMREEPADALAIAVLVGSLAYLLFSRRRALMKG